MESREGYGKTALPLSALVAEGTRDRYVIPGIPSLVFIAGRNGDEAQIALERKLFDERVAFGSRFVNRFRIVVDDIASVPDRERYQKEAPLVVLLRADGSEVTRLSGASLKAATLFSHLARITKENDPRLNLTTLVAREQKHLDAIDRAYWAALDTAPEISELEAHLAEHRCQNGARELERVKERLAKINAARDRALEQEREILALIPVVPAAPPAKDGLPR